MLFFLLFIVLMPALTYADYRLYGKKMEETLAAQPDYDQNRENYDALLAKLMARQKKTDIIMLISVPSAKLMIQLHKSRTM